MEKKQPAMTPDQLHRYQLESAIIGACLLENCYVRVGNILSPKNFSYWGEKGNFNTVWSAIESIYPGQIDIITVTDWIRKNKNEHYAVIVTELTTAVNSTVNVEQHAIILLEMDILLKFREMVTKIKAAVSANKMQSAAISEVIDKANQHGVDVFDLIEAAISYLKKIDLDEVSLNKLVEFNAAVDKKIVFQIKRESQKQALFNHLFTMYSGGNVGQITAIMKLIDTCREISARGVSAKQKSLIDQL